MAEPQSVDIKTVAKILNITERRIQQLVAEGKLPRAEKGKYSLLLCIRAYIDHLQAAASGRDTAPDNLKKHRARLTAARADVAELERDALAGRQVPVEQVERVWSASIGAMRARLLTIPTKIAARIAAAKTPNEAQEIVRREIVDALGELAKVTVVAVAGEAGAGGSGDQHLPDAGAAARSDDL